MTSVCCLPVVVGEFEIISSEEHLAILQPYDVGFWDALSHAGEHSTAPYWLGNGLRPLQELRRGWGDEHRVPANRGDALVHNVIRQTGLSKATCSAFRNMLFRGGDDAYCTRTHVRLQRF